jgi:putative transposase
VLDQPRTTQRRVKKVRSDEVALRTDVVRLASRFGRYGYRQITNLLRIERWRVTPKRVERIWRQEGLKVPRRQPKRGRLWLNDGSCIRLRTQHKNHVWSYDFVSTRDGVWPSRSLEGLEPTMCSRFSPTCSSGTDRPSICARTMGRSSRQSSCGGGWPGSVCRRCSSNHGSPWENGYVESFNGKLRDEFLNGEIAEAVVLVEQWRRLYNTVRPHRAFGGRPPAPETIKPSSWFLGMPQLLGPPMAQGLT